MIQPPAHYVEGYRTARAYDPELEDAYVASTLAGDPLADAAMASLAVFDQQEAYCLIEVARPNGEHKMALQNPAGEHGLSNLFTG